MIRLGTKNCNKLLTKKQQMSALSCGKFDEYEYLAGEEILLSNERQIIEQANFAYSPLCNRQIIEQAIFAYSPLGKAFEKQIKAIKDQGKKQIKVLI